MGGIGHLNDERRTKMGENFTQLCVWPGTMMGEDSTAEEFERFFLEQGYRVKFAEEVVTLPDVENGRAVEGTGGRHDVLFFIHKDDVGKFALPRLRMGIRWWEDVVKYNDNSHLYTQEILDKYPTTW